MPDGFDLKFLEFLQRCFPITAFLGIPLCLRSFQHVRIALVFGGMASEGSENSALIASKATQQAGCPCAHVLNLRTFFERNLMKAEGSGGCTGFCQDCCFKVEPLGVVECLFGSVHKDAQGCAINFRQCLSHLRPQSAVEDERVREVPSGICRALWIKLQPSARNSSIPSSSVLNLNRSIRAQNLAGLRRWWHLSASPAGR